MRFLFSFLLVTLLVLSVKVLAQTDNRPTLRYSSGDEVVGPVTGVRSVIPEGWSGVLPRGSELFLLLPNDGRNGEIYISVGKAISLSQRKANWLAGLELGNGNVLKSDGLITNRNGNGSGNLCTNLVLSERTTDRKGYIELVCGKYGNCLTATLLSSPEELESMKKALFSFMDAITWHEPGELDLYSEFNWQEFLTNKHMINHDYVANAKSENDIWLCSDGTFRTKLKRGGDLKDQAEAYKGSKSGTWVTKSIGSTGTLTLNYNKLQPLEVSLEIKDEKVLLNGKRYIVLNSTSCK